MKTLDLPRIIRQLKFKYRGPNEKLATRVDSRHRVFTPKYRKILWKTKYPLKTLKESQVTSFLQWTFSMRDVLRDDRSFSMNNYPTKMKVQWTKPKNQQLEEQPKIPKRTGAATSTRRTSVNLQTGYNGLFCAPRDTDYTVITRGAKPPSTLPAPHAPPRTRHFFYFILFATLAYFTCPAGELFVKQRNVK